MTGLPGQAAAAPPDAYGVQGFDTSHHKHGDGETEPIDFAAAAASGQKFVFMKATQGTGYTDPWFERDLKGAADAGLPRAPYHFFDEGGGAEQAAHFADVAKKAGYTGANEGELPPALDFEPVNGACPAGLDAEQVGAALSTVEKSFERKPVVYTSAHFVDQCLGGDGSVFAGHTLWQPRYESGEKEPVEVPGAGAPWSFWQYTETGQVDGVPSDAVDRNVFRGSEEELRKLANLAQDAAPKDAVTRAQMLERAATWLTADDGAQVPYSQTETWSDGYRQDCSGYVSMTLGLGSPGANTVMLAQDRGLTTPIGIDELKPGDLLIDADGDSNTRHVVIFEGWTDDSRTAYTAFEQRGGHGTDHRTLDYGLDEGSEFTPYRPVNLTD
nr:glycoside hydrolase family 25 protein [Streptomyces sp. HNM0574]